MTSDILSTVGRLRYLKPLYKTLIDGGYRKEAMQFFSMNENFYCPIAQNTIKGILGLKSEQIEGAPRYPKEIRTRGTL